MKFYALALMGGLCIFPAACVAARNTLETIPARRHKVHVSPLVWKTLGMLQRRGKTLHNFSADLLLTTSHRPSKTISCRAWACATEPSTINLSK